MKNKNEKKDRNNIIKFGFTRMKSNESDTFFFFNKRWNRLPGTMIGHAGMFRFTNRFESKQTDKYDVYAGDG